MPLVAGNMPCLKWLVTFSASSGWQHAVPQVAGNMPYLKWQATCSASSGLAILSILSGWQHAVPLVTMAVNIESGWQHTRPLVADVNIECLEWAGNIDYAMVVCRSHDTAGSLLMEFSYPD